MGRLIIIGNGYDLHYLKGATAYKKFGEWLCNKYNLSLDNKNELPFSKDLDIYTGSLYSNTICGFPKDIAKKVDSERSAFFAAMLVNMIQDLQDSKNDSTDDSTNETWSSFETNLAKLPWKKYIKDADSFFESKKPYGSPVSFGTCFITSSVCNIYSLFSEWASKIDSTPLVKNTFKNRIKAINQDDTVLIFNYTDTFEMLFGLQSSDSRVCHIHGTASKKDSIVVGHGSKLRSESPDLHTVSDYIKNAKATLYKNTDVIMERNKKTWAKIESDFSNGAFNEVWVYGWSGKGVDKPYLKRIVQIVRNSNKECTLFLNCYKCDGYKKKSFWKKNGFPGKILLFTDDELEE